MHLKIGRQGFVLTRFKSKDPLSEEQGRVNGDEIENACERFHDGMLLVTGAENNGRMKN